MIHFDPTSIQLKLKQEAGKPYVFDPVRKSWMVLTPEEHVRQVTLHYLIEKMQYPISLIAVEKQISVGELTKRFDIVVYNRNHKPWLLAECKAPEVAISEATLLQLLNYQSVMQCDYWLLTNGHRTFCADACNVNNIKWLDALPLFQ